MGFTSVKGAQNMINDDFAGVGIDYDKGLEIFMGNRELYHQFLKK